MVNPPFVNGSYYHIYNRGVEKRDIFINKWDYLRFLETINFYRYSPQPMKLSDFRRGLVRLKKNESKKEIIRIFSYCLMPNHFHVLAQQLVDGGITTYLRKSINSYTRYFNTKYDRIGPLFQGTFKARLVETDEYILQVSKYIHRNPLVLKRWRDSIYPYSSYGYYLSGDKHPFCDTAFLLSYFSKRDPNVDYKSFVEEEMNNPNVFSLLIDSD